MLQYDMHSYWTYRASCVSVAESEHTDSLNLTSHAHLGVIPQPGSHHAPMMTLVDVAKPAIFPWVVQPQAGRYYSAGK
jgi:hypothetical protein